MTARTWPAGSTRLGVRCPHCRASEGNRCVNPATGKPLKGAPCHDAREQAWAAHLGIGRAAA